MRTPAPTDIGASLLVLVREELAEAQRQLERARKGRDRAVHKARKSMQRLRGLLRLLRPVKRGQAKRANRRIRDLRRRLGALRDARARFDLLSRLARSAHWATHSDRLGQLAAREREALREAWGAHPPDAKFWDDLQQEFAALAAELPALAWHRVDASALEAAQHAAVRVLERRVAQDQGVCDYEARHAVRCALRRYASLRALAAGVGQGEAAEACAMLAKRCGREGDYWMAAEAARRAARRGDSSLRQLAESLEVERQALCTRNRRALARLGLVPTVASGATRR